MKLSQTIAALRSKLSLHELIQSSVKNITINTSQITKTVFIASCIIFLNSCGNSKPILQNSYLTISNTGTYTLPSPQVCYYQEHDKKSCEAINPAIKEILPKESASFIIQAQHRARLVLPFNTIHQSGGVAYRPNCHILIDWVPFPEKNYFIDAQIISNLNQPANGFNCSSTMFEETLDSGEKININDNITQTIRYRVPRKGENKAGYVSDYHWK